VFCVNHPRRQRVAFPSHDSGAFSFARIPGCLAVVLGFSRSTVNWFDELPTCSRKRRKALANHARARIYRTYREKLWRKANKPSGTSTRDAILALNVRSRTRSHASRQDTRVSPRPRLTPAPGVAKNVSRSGGRDQPDKWPRQVRHLHCRGRANLSRRVGSQSCRFLEDIQSSAPTLAARAPSSATPPRRQVPK